MCKPGVDSLLIVSLEGRMDVQQLEFGRGLDYMQPLTVNMPNLGNALMTQIVSLRGILEGSQQF